MKTNLKLGNVLILGDSYSTYEGWIPEGYAVYYLPGGEETRGCLSGVEETWWHRLLTDTGAHLVRNDSWSGAAVCTTGYGPRFDPVSSFVMRIRNFLKDGLCDGERVDTVLLCGGTNDNGCGAEFGELKFSDWTDEDLRAFLPAFCCLLHDLRERLPGARIINITNCDLKTVVAYGMANACAHYGVENVLLHGIDKFWGHPTAVGMYQIEAQILASLAKKKGAADQTLWDVPYGDHPRHRLDLFLPAGLPEKAGLILHVHGGAFLAGSKEVYRAQIAKHAHEGFACAALNYRYTSEEVSLSDMLDDITSALRKIRELCSERGILLSGMLISGGSAGAHMALQYAYTRMEEAPVKPAAVVSFCATTDISAREMAFATEIGKPETLCGIFSKLLHETVTPENFEAMAPALRDCSPIAHITPATVPTVICHGLQDNAVPYAQAEALATELSRNGVRHELIPFPNSGHGLDKDPVCGALADRRLLELARELL